MSDATVSSEVEHVMFWTELGCVLQVIKKTSFSEFSVCCLAPVGVTWHTPKPIVFFYLTIE